MHGKFNQLRLLADGTVDVSGPFDPEQSNLRAATVFFLIVQGEGEPQTLSIEGTGTWEEGQSDWSANVSAAGRCADGSDGTLDASRDGGRVRGIAVALATRPPERSLADPAKFDPPTVEALTWCAETTLVAAADASQRPA